MTLAWRSNFHHGPYSYAQSPAGLLGIVLLAATVLPVWAGVVFPSLDGPVHPYIADVLRHYPTSTRLQQFFVINWNPDPNLLIYPLLYALEGVLAPPTAEKVLVTLIAISLFASAVYVLRALRADAPILSLLICRSHSTICCTAASIAIR